MSESVYAYPSDLLADIATSIVWQSGTADANYPIANVKDRRADTVAKVTGANGTIRVTFSSSKTLQGIVLVNTNASVAQVTNGAGLNVAIPIPATPLDGLRLDPWLDLRGVSLTSSTQWDIALTGPGPTALGELLLVQTWRVVPLLWQLKERRKHGAEILVTDYGARNKWQKGVRQRAVVGSLIDEAYRAPLIALMDDARGAVRNFPLILETSVNDALYVDLTVEEREMTRVAPLATTWDLEFTEQQKGIL